MNKKFYYICISGESAGLCYRKLSDDEYSLINGIFDECESNYCGGSIEEVIPYWVVEVVYNATVITDMKLYNKSINNKERKGTTLKNFVRLLGHRFVPLEGSQTRQYEFPDYPDRQKHFYFNTEQEALDAANKMAEELNADLQKLYVNDTLNLESYE